MKRLSLILLSMLFLLPAFAGKKDDKATLSWKYEVQDLGVVAKDGRSVIFKIWSYGKNEKKATLQAGKNAVHAVMFKQIGYNPALAGTSSIETEYASFMKTFFADGGEYMRFVTFANNGAIAAGDKVKVGNEMKVGMRVTVDRASLRQYLEEKGVLKSMNSMF